MKCGLLGRKLGHSYSPQIHAYLGSYEYVLFEKEPEDLEFFLHSHDFQGLNVTMPYKIAVIPYCTELSQTARKLGAVNTIVKRPDGSLIGHNTDFFGFSSMLDHSGLDVNGKKVLVLGSGGASATVTAVLAERGADVVVISRSGKNNYSNLEKHTDASVIVNTTPVGMFPNTGVSPVDIKIFPSLDGVLDVVYNPARTQLLLDAEQLGLTAVNGLWMLVAQAKESAEWFAGRNIPNSVISKIYLQLSKQMQNTVLIGMPGCGKTTIGQLIAKELKKTFVDSDKIIEERAKMTIPEIFTQYDEKTFRKYETAVLADLGKQSGLVIATGGGCVTHEQNYAHLHQNGTIYWLKRQLALLPTNGRPLSVTGNLSTMFAARAPLYTRFADIIVDNNGDLMNTVHAILEKESAT